MNRQPLGVRHLEPPPPSSHKSKASQKDFVRLEVCGLVAICLRASFL